MQHPFWSTALRILVCASVCAPSISTAQGTAYCLALQDTIAPADLVVATDGSLYVCGTSESDHATFAEDIFLLKVGPDGALLWSERVDGGGGDRAAGLVATSDGGVLLVGSGTSFVMPSSGYVIRFGPTGSILWSKQLTNQTGATTYAAYTAIGSNDGGYLVGGSAFRLGQNNASLIKLNSTGDVIWTRFYRIPNISPSVISLAEEPLGGYYAASDGSGTFPSLFKVDASGEFMWGRSNIGALDICARPGGGVYMASGWAYDMLVVAVDSGGTLVWQTDVGIGSLYERSVAVASTPDGGVVVAGDVNSIVQPRLALVKLDAYGSLEWGHTAGPVDVYAGVGVVRFPDGGFAGLGSMGPVPLGGPSPPHGIFIERTDPGGLPCDFCSAADVQNDSMGSTYTLINSGWPNESTGAESDPVTFSVLPGPLLVAYCNTLAVGPSIPSASDRLRVAPQPVSRWASILIPEAWLSSDRLTLSIADATGRVVRGIPVGSAPYELDTDGLTPGAYMLNVRSGPRVLGSARMILE